MHDAWMECLFIIIRGYVEMSQANDNTEIDFCRMQIAINVRKLTEYALTKHSE